MKEYQIHIITVLLLFNSSLFAQNEISNSEMKYAKNTFYGTAGYSAIFNGIGLSYERNLVLREDKKLNSIWLKGRASYTGGLMYGGFFYDVSGVSLFGKSDHKFELGIGAGWFPDYVKALIDQNVSKPFFPDISFGIGYRYQKSAGNKLFRFGFGFPEGFYLSYGLAF